MYDNFVNSCGALYQREVSPSVHRCVIPVHLPACTVYTHGTPLVHPPYTHRTSRLRRPSYTRCTPRSVHATCTRLNERRLPIQNAQTSSHPAENPHYPGLPPFTPVG